MSAGRTRGLKDLVREELRSLTKYEIPHPEGITVRLDANESPYPLDADVTAELTEHLARIHLNRYPDGNQRRLKEVLSHALGVGVDQISVGNGSDEIIALLIGVFSRPRPGGGGKARVLYPVPSFVVYRMASLAHGALPLEVPLKPDFTLDAAALDRSLTGVTPNLAFFALPNNPTGTLWDRGKITQVVADHPNMLVVADEAYFDYAGETYLDLLPAHENLLVMRTLSKIGLASLRVGYLVGHADLIAEVEKVRPPYNVGTLNQAAASFLLERHADRLRARIAAIVAERRRLADALASRDGIHVFESRANFVLVRVGEPGDGAATALWQALAERGVLVRNFDRPGPLSGCLRVTVGTPAENDALLAALPATLPASARR